MNATNVTTVPRDFFLTTRDAALQLGVSLRTVQLWVEAGTLPAGRTPGGHRRIRQADVTALREQCGLDAAPKDQPAGRNDRELALLLAHALALTVPGTDRDLFEQAPHLDAQEIAKVIAARDAGRALLMDLAKSAI